MAKIKFMDYVAAMMKRNILAGYEYCVNNKVNQCKVNTMIMEFDFSNSFVRVKSQGQKTRHYFNVVTGSVAA